MQDFGVDPGDIKRVILHWTAGGPTPNDWDLRPYHVLIDGNAKVIEGKFSVDDNIDTNDGRYAAHTLHANTKAAGISLCGMRGAVESPLDFGPNPFNEKQFRRSAEVAAQMLWNAGLECEPHTALSHAEVEDTLGIKQRNKWDITVLPWRSDIRGAHAVGNYWRGLVRAEMAKRGPIEVHPTDSITTLRPGNRVPSRQVQALQKRLAEMGYHSGSTDGLFGKLTRASVIAFQSENGLTPDGIVGPLTWRALFEVEARPERPVEIEDLEGSRTIAVADTTEKAAISLAGIGSVTTVLDGVVDAENTLASAQSILMQYWPLLAFGAVGFGGYYIAKKQRWIRLDDAKRGRNLGR